MVCSTLLLLFLAPLIEAASAEDRRNASAPLPYQRELDALSLRLDNIALEVKEKRHKLEARAKRSRRETTGHDVPPPTQLRHGFVPETNVGNRESVEITGFQYLPSRAVKDTLTFWQYFEYKREDFLVTYIVEQDMVHVFAFDIDVDPFGGEARLTTEFLTSVASFPGRAEHASVFGLPRRTQPIEKYEVMFVALYTDMELQLHTFYEIGDTGDYVMVHNQTINAEDVTDTDAFIMDTDLYLVLSRCRNDTSDAWVKSVLYKWNVKRSQFELHQVLKTHYAQSVVGMHMMGKDYIIFAEKENLTSVWKYDTRQLQFKPYLRLWPGGCVGVEEFSLGFHNFLVLTTANRSQANILRWTGFRYENFQVIYRDNINSWKAMKTPNCQDGVLLALSHGYPYNTFELYVFDYTIFQFQALNHTGHFTNGTSHVFMASDRRIFAGVSGRDFRNWVKVFEVYYESSEVPDPILVQSKKLQRTHVTIVDELNAINSSMSEAEQLLIDSVRLSGNSVINGTKIFPRILVNGSMTTNVIVTGGTTIHQGRGPDGVNSQPYLEQNLTRHADEIEIINGTLNASVSLDTYQEVFGVKTFLNSTTNHSVTATHLETDVINGVWLEQLVNTSVWVNREGQEILGSLRFTEPVQADDDVIVGGHVNGIDLSEDAVTENTEQTITGQKQFQRDITITGDMDFDDGVTLDGVDVSEEVVTLTGSHTLTESITFTDPVHVAGNIDTSQTVDGVLVSALAQNILFIEGDQTLQGATTFTKTPVFRDDIDLRGTANGVDLSDLSEQAVRHNRNETISGEKTFTADLSVDGDVLVTELIDGVDLSGVLTLQGSQTVTGHKYFASGVGADNVNVTGSVDGIDLSTEAVTLTGNHVIGGVKNLTDGAHFDVDVVTSGLVDGVDVSELAFSVLTKSGNQTIQGPFTFDKDVTFEDSLEVEGLINGVNITFLEGDVVYSDLGQEQTITAPKTFSDNVTLSAGVLEANGLFNGVNVSNDLLDLYRNQTITGMKTFEDGFDATANVTLTGSIDGWTTEDLGYLPVSYLSDTNLTDEKTIIGNVTFDNASDDILGEVNGVDISDDLMMVNREQNVTGVKTFDVLQVEEDLQMTDLTVQDEVNGRNWEDFIDNRITLSTNQSISGYLNFTDTAHVTDDVTVGGLVNGFNITELAENTMSKTKPQTVTGQKTITGLIDSSGDATFLGLVDGVNISDWRDNAMRLTGNQTIMGAKVFVDPLEVQGSIEVSELVNTVNVTFMDSDAVMRGISEEQIIAADKIFEDGIDLKSDLTVRSLVNGIDLGDAVTLSGEQEISGSYHFTEGLSVDGDVEVYGLINDVNLTFIDAQALRLDREEDVNSHKVFKDEIFITNDVDVTELSDTVDVSELTANSLKVDEPFEIGGDIMTNNTITFLGDLDLVGTGDGEDLGDWAARVVLKHTDQDINDTKIFSGSITVDNPVTVNGTLEISEVFGVNISSWSADIVYRDENNTITGTKTFEDDIHVGGDVHVDGTVDGIDISEEVVTLSEEQTITGKKTFSASVNTSEDIVVSDLVNGYYLPDMEGDTFMVDSPMTVTGNKTFAEDLPVDGDVTLSGSINGSPYEEPMNLFDDHTVTGHWEFDAETTFVNNLQVNGLTSSLNLTHIRDHRITLSDDSQVAEGPLVFTEDVIFQSDVGQGPINGMDLLEMEQFWESFLDQTNDKISEMRYVSAKLCDAIDELQETYAGALSDFDYFEKIQDVPDQTQSMTAFHYNSSLYLAVAVYAEDHVYTCVESSVYEWVDGLQEFVAIDSILTNGAMKFEAFQIDRWQFLAVANAGIFPCDGDDRVYSTVFIFNSTFVHYQAIPISSMDVEAFLVDDVMYLVFAGEENSIHVYTHKISLNRFVALQSIELGSGACAVEFLEAGGRSLLVVSESALETASVFIIAEGGNFILHQRITSRYAYDIASYTMNGQDFVVFAGYTTNSDVWGITEDTNSLVYYWSEDSDTFELADYEIPFRRVSDVSYLSLGFHSYLILVEQYKKVELFRYEGSGHFVSRFTMPIDGVKSVEAFKIGYDVYLAISIDPLIDTNPSMIVRAEMLGHLYEVVGDLCDYTFGATVYHDEEELCDLGLGWGVGLDREYVRELKLNETAPWYDGSRSMLDLLPDDG